MVLVLKCKENSARGFFFCAPVLHSVQCTKPNHNSGLSTTHTRDHRPYIYSSCVGGGEREGRIS